MKSENPISNSQLLHSDTQLLSAFQQQEAQERITNTKVGCALVVTLMPAGSLLDYFVYRDWLFEFFVARVSCSVIAASIWAFLHTEPGRKASKWLGVVVPLLPAVFIAGMIAVTEGFASPYYAGLNLVLLAVGFVLQWTVSESVFAVLFVLVIYLAAGLIYGKFPPHYELVNNFYFISLMDIIVVVGTFFQSRQRFREFSLRSELDDNRRKLEQNNEKLRELSQVKDRFFANISHELRTPLTLLVSPLEILLFKKGSLLTDEQKGLAQMMHANAMRLLKMINDLLDLVRLESGRMEVKQEPVDVSEFVKSLNSATRQLAHDRQLQLRTQVAPELTSVLADRDKLEKICLNLLFNALKFTPAGGIVELTVQSEQDQLIIAIKDTGVGISPKNLPFVFDRFWQADNSSKRKFKGVGIGLSLVKELTEIQGGKATVESEEGQGTTFTIRLPYVKADMALSPPDKDTGGETSGAGKKSETGVQSEEWLTNLYRRAELFATVSPNAFMGQEAIQREAASIADKGGRPTILIADDEPGMVSFLKSQLQQQYHVIEAVDGREAVEKVSQHLPDVVLLDMNMPEKDGLQVCRELRENPGTDKIPIILLTARADEETKLAALSAGASDFLAKPFSTTELHVRIKNLMESFHYQRKLAKQNQLLESTIEQLKETETQLVQTEKLASLGRMSAGIIHEINNPLNFATTGLYTLRKKGKLLGEEQQAEFTEVLQDVEEGIKRVKDIVSDLITFTHPDNEQVENVDVADVIASAMRFLSNEIKDRVRVEVNLPKHHRVQANNNRLTQVFVNLLQNSVDGLKEKSFDGEQPTIWIEGRVDPEKSVVIIRDNGQGIEPQNMGKIFDPFFTTKDVGEGMGLGLSICYRIVQEYQGQIRVKSERGKFCEFTLEFVAKPAQ